MTKYKNCYLLCGSNYIFVVANTVLWLTVVTTFFCGRMLLTRKEKEECGSERNPKYMILSTTKVSHYHKFPNYSTVHR